MGTNYYRMDRPADEYEDEDPRRHIGKRSAAGAFCWDCGLTLCKGGNERIHFSDSEWHDACPQCGATPVRESLAESDRLELGFANHAAVPERAGRSIRQASSFTWAQDPEGLPENVTVEDEYGRTFTMRQFREDVLGACPVQFTDYTGAWFC